MVRGAFALISILVACHTTADPLVVAPSTPDASVPVSVVEASAPMTTMMIADAGVEASMIEAGTPCLVGGKPCNPHCQMLADKYLVMPPMDGTCDKTPCTIAGGTCDYAGFCFGQACIRRAKDAGRPCSDGSQCQSGGCVAPSGAATGSIAVGKCATPTLLLGCHVMVNGGKVGLGICGD